MLYPAPVTNLVCDTLCPYSGLQTCHLSGSPLCLQPNVLCERLNLTQSGTRKDAPEKRAVYLPVNFMLLLTSELRFVSARERQFAVLRVV